MTGDEVMNLVEGVVNIADLADQLKGNLEARGWSAQNAEVAAITLTNTILLKQ